MGRLVPFPELVEEIIDLVAEDAVELGCLSEVVHARTIIERGTSAHRQLDTYQSAIEGGASPDEARRAVVDFLIDETVAGL